MSLIKKQFEVVLGKARHFGDIFWHVGFFREGNCFSWSSFATKAEAEKWMKNPSVAVPPETVTSFLPN